MIRIFVGAFLAAVFVGGLGIIALAAGGSRSLDAYLVLASLLFAIGMFGFLARRNAISMLMSIELMLNAVNLSIVAFGGFVKGLGTSGSVIAANSSDSHSSAERASTRTGSSSSCAIPRPRIMSTASARRRIRCDEPVSGR